MSDQQQTYAMPQQMGPSLAELLPLIPEAGHVYLDLAIAKWQHQREQALHEQTRQQLVAARAALLGHGIDPITLQPVPAPDEASQIERRGPSEPEAPKGEPEKAPKAEGNGAAPPKARAQGAHD